MESSGSETLEQKAPGEVEGVIFHQLLSNVCSLLIT